MEEHRARDRCRTGLVAAVLSLAVTLQPAHAAPAPSGETLLGRSTSVTRNTPDWKSFFNGEMREVVTRAQTVTEYDADTSPVSIEGVTIDVRGQSPIHTDATVRTIARKGDPEFGTVRLESVSTTAAGEVVKTAYSFKQGSPDAAIAVGPLAGGEMSLPPREQVIGGRTFVVRSVSRITKITALLVAPSFEDLLAGREVHEVRERGAHVESGSMRVLSADGTLLGYYAGDLRVSRGEDHVSPK